VPQRPPTLADWRFGPRITASGRPMLAFIGAAVFPTTFPSTSA